MTLELKDNLSKQIQEDVKNTERLAKVIQELGVDLSKLSKEKIELNISKNLKDAENGLYKLFDIQDKITKALSRNSSMKGEGFLGMDESRLLRASAAIDEIVRKIMNVGAEANFQGNYVKNLMASLSADLALKEGKNAASEMEKGLTKQAKERAKAEKAATKEIKAAFEEADNAAKTNAKNQQLVQDALARIATARAQLSAASNSANEQDQMHARLLMTLLDKLAERLNNLKGQFLGEKGMLDEVLGSGYRGLMRNVNTSTSNIDERNRQHLQELAVAYENKAKAQAEAMAQEERAFVRQQSFYKSQQNATQATRQRTEELVKLRMELLKTQAAELQWLMKNGKNTFSTRQYEEVVNALRSIRQEMRQLEGVAQRMGSYSTKDLLGFIGSQNWSPLVANAQHLLSAQQGVRQLSIEEEKLKQSIEQASQAMNGQNRILSDLQMMTQNYLSLWGAKSFLNNIIEIGGQLEMQRLSIGAILGDTAHANDLFERIKALAVQSPFGVVELDQYTKQLSAYGFKYNELYDMTKRLADISAGAGTQVGRLALALGHVRSEAALSGYTLRQFAMNNVPMVGELAKMLTEVEGKIVSVADVRKRVRNKEISYEDVEAVIKRLTDEGGMFYNMQEVISQSVKARFKNLKDSLDIMYGEMAESDIGGSLKTVATTLTNLTRHWKELAAVIQSGIVVLATYKAVMLSNQLLLGREAAAVQAGTMAKLRADSANIKLASSYRLLTAEELKFNGITGQTLIMANALALSEKKITAEHIARQVALGRLTKQEALQAIALADLTAAERIHAQTIIGNVYTYGRYTAAVNGITMAVGRLGAALKTIFWNPLTAVFAGIGIMTEVWQRNNEEVERAETLNDSLFNRATEGIKNIKQMMNETGIDFYVGGKIGDFGDIDQLKNGTFEFAPASSLSTAELMTTIEKWTQFIKEYAATPNNILNNAFSDDSGKVRDLAEQYTLLGQAVKETAGAYVWLKQASDAAEFAEKFSNDDGLWGITNDSLVTNINDYAQDLKDYNDAVTTSVARNRQFWSSVLKAARGNIAFSSALKENKIDSENLGEQIKLLIENENLFEGAINRARKEADKMGKELSEFDRTPDSYIPGIGYDTTIKDYFTSMSESQSTMEADMDVWIQGLKERLAELGWNINSLTKEQGNAVALAIAETVAKANKGTDEIRKDVINLMKEKFGITIDADTAKAVAKVAGLKKSLEDLVGHDWTIDVKAATDFDDVISTIRKSYKSAKEYFENAKPLAIKMGIDVSGGMKVIGEERRKALLDSWKQNNPGKDATMYEQFLDEWDRLAKEMNNAIGFSEKTGISLTDPNKGNKGNKKDTQLEKAKQELDDIKKFYAEFKKYREVYKDDKKSQSLVEQIFGMKPGEGDKIVNDYKGSIMKVISAFKEGSPERKKFYSGGLQLIGDIDLDKDKKSIDEAFKEMQEYITKRTGQWNLYKQILDKTGSKEMAQNAFSDTRIFDDAARELEKKLSEVSGGNILDYNATQVAAEKYYDGNKQAYELWKKIVDLTSNNWTNALNKGADAYASLLSVSEKIKKNEEEIARLRKEGAGVPGNEARIMALQKENDKLSYEQFQQGSDYLRFFGSILTMTTSEVEKTAQTIKNRLITELSRGNINARQYTKSLKEVNDQLTKSRTVLKGVKGAFLTGGQQGVVDYREQEVNNASLRVEAAQKELDAIKKREAAGEAVSASDKALAELKLSNAKTELANATKALGISLQAYTTLSSISMAISIIKGAFEGFSKIGHTLAETLEAFGDDDTAADWETMGDTFDAMNKALAPIDNVVGNLMKGNISGALGSVISAPVDMITGPMVAFAKMHDKQLQREIEASQARQKELENLTKNLERVLDRTLGGVYNTKASQEDRNKLLLYEARNNFGKKLSLFSGGNIYGYLGDNTLKAIGRALETETYYDTKLAELMLQRDEVKKQMQAEEDKKDSDGNAIEDYKNQIAELDDEIKYFAQDMAKALYDIDVKSWASELGDALFEAWKKGEDAAEAWKKKVGEIIADVSKNIIVTKMIETAFKPVEDYIVEMMTENSGMLDPLSFANELIPLLDTAYNDVSGTLSTTLDAIEAVLQKNGMTMKDSSSSTASKVIQGGFTENETGLLLSYVNAIRADVSINRYTLEQIMMAVQGQADMPSIASAQLAELRTIASNTRRNADFAADIYDILKKAQTGVQGLKVV